MAGLLSRERDAQGGYQGREDWRFHVFSRHHPFSIATRSARRKEGLQAWSTSFPCALIVFRLCFLKQGVGPNTHPSGSLRQPLEVSGSIAEQLKAKERQGQMWGGRIYKFCHPIALGMVVVGQLLQTASPLKAAGSTLRQHLHLSVLSKGRGR